MTAPGLMFDNASSHLLHSPPCPVGGSFLSLRTLNTNQPHKLVPELFYSRGIDEMKSRSACGVANYMQSFRPSADAVCGIEMRYFKVLRSYAKLAVLRSIYKV